MEITGDLVPVPVLSLPDEVSLLSRSLSRTLPIQILKQLQKKQMSACELASELKIRLNTLTYNLEVLKKAGLIKVIQVKWSCKGREVKIYAPAEQPILLVPRANKDMTPFVLDALEKTLGHCWKNSPGWEISLPERSDTNNKHVFSDKENNNKEVLSAYTRYAVIFPFKETHDHD